MSSMAIVHEHLHACRMPVTVCTSHMQRSQQVHMSVLMHVHALQVVKVAMDTGQQRVPLILICGGLLPRVPYNGKKV